MIRNVSVASLLCLTSTIAHAQVVHTTKGVICTPTLSLLTVMRETDVNENPVWVGKDGDEKSNWVVFVNRETGAFTLAQLGAEVSCVVGVGSNSQFVSPPTITGKPMSLPFATK